MAARSAVVRFAVLSLIGFADMEAVINARLKVRCSHRNKRDMRCSIHFATMPSNRRCRPLPCASHRGLDIVRGRNSDYDGDAAEA